MSVAGVFKVTMNTPMGAQEITLTLNEEGGSLSGSMSGAQGTQEFSGGTVDGDSASWNVEMTQPMEMTLEFTATVDGDDISGDAKLGSFGNASFAGART